VRHNIAWLTGESRALGRRGTAELDKQARPACRQASRNPAVNLKAFGAGPYMTLTLVPNPNYRELKTDKASQILVAAGFGARLGSRT
jgi:hypothetical protein